MNLRLFSLASIAAAFAAKPALAAEGPFEVTRT